MPVVRGRARRRCWSVVALLGEASMLGSAQNGGLNACLAILSLALAGCSGGSEESDNLAVHNLTVDNLVIVDNPREGPAEDALEPLTKPVKRYHEREGDTYFYIAAVSEEDQKKGRVTGEVIGYRYLGNSGGVYRIESADRGANYECANPCRIIKTRYQSGNQDRIAFSAGSIIGSVFTDAFNGYLVPTTGFRSDKTQEKVDSASAGAPLNTIPAAFVGEWNADLGSCGTGLSDSRLRIEPSRMRFYESDAEVTRVVVHNIRSVHVEASFAGEGETWRDSVTMVLSRSGNELTIDGSTRSRCPS